MDIVASKIFKLFLRNMSNDFKIFDLDSSAVD